MKKYSRSTLFKTHLILLSLATLTLSAGILSLIYMNLLHSEGADTTFLAVMFLGGSILGLITILITAFLKCDNCHKYINVFTLKGGEVKALPNWARLMDQIYPKEIKSNYFKCKYCESEYLLK